MPLAVYDALGSAVSVSRAYFLAGIVSLVWGLMVPWATRHLPRRWMYSVGASLYLVAMALAATGGSIALPIALIAMAIATVTTFVCFNSYVLDCVPRAKLGRSQTMNMLFAGAPWCCWLSQSITIRHFRDFACKATTGSNQRCM